LDYESAFNSGFHHAAHSGYGRHFVSGGPFSHLNFPASVFSQLLVALGVMVFFHPLASAAPFMARMTGFFPSTPKTDGRNPFYQISNFVASRSVRHAGLGWIWWRYGFRRTIC
jgi:hypothetical protein